MLHEEVSALIHGNKNNQESSLGGKKVDDECSNSLKEGGEKMNVKDGFVGYLNGEQFPPISNKAGIMNVGNKELKEFLDKEDNCSGDANINKDDCEETVIIGNDNANSSNKDVNVVNDKSEEGISKAKINMQSTGKSRNNVVKLIDIVNSSKLDNKLLSVPTQISETVNGMKWNIDMCLNKAEPKRIPVWVKLVNVPMEAWSVNGINALASSIGKPIIMDEVTTKMCVIGVGRIGFARVLVEIDVEKGIKAKIEIIYKSKNVVECTKKVVDVE
nr:RNA-directed DNA polymerase, eukaryota, reverse transcriptase zinc-binding domain protein [Tanacetum cinerariifolium]